VQKAAREHQLGIWKLLAQHVVLVDRQIVGVARIDLHEPDATAFELELADALDHYLGIAPVAAVAHVVYRDLDLPPYRFRVRPAHGIDERGLAFERNEHVAGKRVPFPMPGEPEHARAKAPVTGAAWHDHYIEPVLGHFRAQSAIAALVFLLRELLPDGIAVIRRVAHVRERQRLIEPRSHHIPCLRPDAWSADIHGKPRQCHPRA
jgi:hypothetical protein